MKTTVTAHVHYVKYSWMDKGEFEVAAVRFDDDKNQVYVGEQQVEIEVPDKYDARPQQIAALEKQKRELLASAQIKATEIERDISKLRALEYTA
jgi:hypothetical protein